MIKIKIEIELPDDFEPYTTGCADTCPFGNWDDTECAYNCSYKEDDCPIVNRSDFYK